MRIVICLQIGKYLSDSYPIQKGLKEGDALWPLLLSLALEYAFRKVQKNQVGLKLYGRRQLLANGNAVQLVASVVELSSTELVS
jgi:hypothetical protein